MSRGARLAIVLVPVTLLGCQQLEEMLGKEKSPVEKANDAMTEADAALQAGDLDAAEAAYRRALTLQPKSVTAVLGLSSIYEQRGENTRAVLELRQAMGQEMLPDDPSIRERMGDILMRQGRYKSAAKAFDEALRRDATRVSAGWKYALALLRDGRVSEAEKQVAYLLDQDATNHHVRAVKGLVLAAQGDIVEARSLLDQAASMSPDPEPSVALGMFFMSQGKGSAAAMAFQSAVEKGGTDSETYRLLAGALVDSGRGEEAVAVLAPITRARPRDPLVLAAHARALVAVGKYDEALAAANKAIGLDPKLGPALLAQGEALEAQGDLPGAIAAYKASSKHAPELTDAYRRLASVYRKVDKFTDAIYALEEVMRLDPGDRRSKTALAELYAFSPDTAEKGLKLVAELLEGDPGEPNLLRLKSELESQARQATRRRPTGPGPTIIRGR